VLGATVSLADRSDAGRALDPRPNQPPRDARRRVLERQLERERIRLRLGSAAIHRVWFVYCSYVHRVTER
jgi:hypothetical protein